MASHFALGGGLASRIQLPGAQAFGPNSIVEFMDLETGEDPNSR